MDIDDLNVCLTTKRLKLAASEEYCIKIIYKEGANKSQFGIQHLPPELITKILEYIPSTYLLKVARLVCRNFQDIIHNIIYRRFLLLGKTLRKLCIHVNLQIKESRPLRIRLKEYDVILYVEMLIIQYCTLRASIWRYMENGSSGLVLCHCSGTVLDTFENVIYKIKHQPLHLRVVFNRCLDVDKLCNLVRGFINRFEVMVEAKANINCFVSGAKVVDLLESAAYMKRNILSETYENGFCKLKVNYRFRDAWFNTAEIRNEVLPHYSWEEDQRLMYNRIRRLVVAHSNFCSEKVNSNVKTRLHPGGKAFYRPSLGAFAAAEEYANRRYYFGCMLPGMYRPLRDNTTENNSLILDINVDMVCPIRYAPSFLYKIHCMDLETKLLKKNIVEKSTRFQDSKFYMNVEFKCDLAKHTKYDSMFNFVISEKHRINNIYKNNI